MGLIDFVTERVGLETREAAERRVWAETKAAEHGWMRYDAAELEPYGKRGLLAHRPSDAILEPVTVDLGWPGDLDRVSGWYLDNGWAKFVGLPSKPPRTLTQAREIADERRRSQEEREDAEQRRLAALPRRAVTLADLEGWPQSPSLREAATTIAAAQGVIRSEDGELVIEIADRLPSREAVLRALRVLFGAQAIVLAELASGGSESLAERLPDAQVRAGGGVE